MACIPQGVRLTSKNVVANEGDGATARHTHFGVTTKRPNGSVDVAATLLESRGSHRRNRRICFPSNDPAGNTCGEDNRMGGRHAIINPDGACRSRRLIESSFSHLNLSNLCRGYFHKPNKHVPYSVPCVIANPPCRHLTAKWSRT